MLRVALVFFFFFFNDTATTEIYTLSLHDALPISWPTKVSPCTRRMELGPVVKLPPPTAPMVLPVKRATRVPLLTRGRSEEHTSELQSHSDIVCRLLLEKKKGLLNVRAVFASSTLV